MGRLAWMAALLMGAVGGCSCDGGGVGSTTAGFRTATSAVDFGRALEGTTIARSLTLSGTGRTDVVVDVSTAAPFAAPQSITVPGGGSVELDVTFTAGTGPSDGTLTLAAHGESFQVALHGVGVHPLDCQPSAPCREARFALETESCVESVSADGASCTPEGRCLENGVCRAGACVGTPRTCDDGNACTQDACAPDVGCIHVDVTSQCPRPANPCEAPTCDPVSGCGSRTLQDDSVCGALDCKTAHLCRSGSCVELPTPDGFLCAPATPCQGEGQCAGGVCVRPDAGVMTPEWSVTLGPSPAVVTPAVGGLLAIGGNLFFQTCNVSSVDGGCALVSYTENGFERFVQPLDAGVSLRLLTPMAALVEDGESLTALGVSGGLPVWSLPLSSDAGTFALPPDALALTSDNRLALALGEPDGGGIRYLLLEPSDGGVLRAESVPNGSAGSALALGSDNAPWLAAPGTAVVHGAQDGDGGIGWTPLATSAVSGRSLSVGDGGALAFTGGARAVDLDGGTYALLEPLDGGFGDAPLDFEVLSNAGTGFVFFRACRQPLPAPCTDEERATLVRAFSLASGQALWETRVLPGLAPGGLVDAQLVSAVGQQGLLTFTQADLPQTGRRADVQLFVDGRRAMLCPLDGQPRVAGALFDQSTLFVLLDREGQWRLEAYNLGQLPFVQTGWPRPGGTPSKARRER